MGVLPLSLQQSGCATYIESRDLSAESGQEDEFPTMKEDEKQANSLESDYAAEG